MPAVAHGSQFRRQHARLDFAVRGGARRFDGGHVCTRSAQHLRQRAFFSVSISVGGLGHLLEGKGGAWVDGPFSLGYTEAGRE